MVTTIKCAACRWDYHYLLQIRFLEAKFRSWNVNIIFLYLKTGCLELESGYLVHYTIGIRLKNMVVSFPLISTEWQLVVFQYHQKYKFCTFIL